MKKKTALMILLVINLIAATSIYSANMTGRIGIGYDTSIQSASLRFFIGNFGIDVLLGFWFEPQNTNLLDDTAYLTFHGGAYFFYPIELLDKVNLNFFAGAIFENVGSHTTNASRINFFIRAGLSPEIFLLDDLSIEAKFGLEISMQQQNATDYRTAVRTFGDNISIVEGFAFHYYLGKK
jgi:hypothetical protein